MQWSIKYVQKLTGSQTILRTRIQPKINKKSWKNQMNTRNEIWIKCEVHGSSAMNISNWFYETREFDVSADRVNEWRMRVVRTKMMNWQHEQNQVNAKHGRPQEFFAGGGKVHPSLSSPHLCYPLSYRLCRKAAPFNSTRWSICRDAVSSRKPRAEPQPQTHFWAGETCWVATILVLFVWTKML